MVKRARYSAEFKAQAVRLVLEEGQHVREVANQLFLSPKTLEHWVQAAREGKVVPAQRIDEKELELVSLRNEKQTITHGVRYPKKSRGVFCKGNAVKYAAIASMRSCYPARLCCALLEVSASGFHAWTTRKPRQTTDARDRLAVAAAHEKTRGVYGAVRLYHELQAEGFSISLWKVKKLRRELGLMASRPRRRVMTTDSRHMLPVADNVLDRQFSCKSPNTAWVSDITHIPTDEGWLYLSGIKDCRTKKIVGFHLSDTMTSNLVIRALEKACARHRPGSDLLLHSDRGSQYCGNACQREITKFRLQCSMSRKGNCHDNAPMESFRGLLKNELVYRTHFHSRRQASRAITEYIEIFYNRQRRQAGLGYLSPAAFARKYWQGKMALAA